MVLRNICLKLFYNRDVMKTCLMLFGIDRHSFMSTTEINVRAVFLSVVSLTRKRIVENIELCCGCFTLLSFNGFHVALFSPLSVLLLTYNWCIFQIYLIIAL